MPPLDVEGISRLKFIREEVRHEFNLLAMRSTILVTCQSFLVVPFSILAASQNWLQVAIPAMLICLLGLTTTALIIVPIWNAHAMMDHWLKKQNDLLKSIDDDVYDMKRDFSDTMHRRSLWFSSLAPFAFLAFWLVLLGWLTVSAAELRYAPKQAAPVNPFPMMVPQSQATPTLNVDGHSGT